MVIKTYQLLPYAQSSTNITIEASLSLTSQQLELSFLLQGVGDHYLFERESQAKRADELWRATCFEAFVKNLNSKEYWELNIAPNGSWNLYRFSDYREDMQEESRVLTPKVLFKQERDKVRVSIKVDFMEKLFDERVDFNLALILLDMEGKRHFFTLNPKEGVADFHDFVLG